MDRTQLRSLSNHLHLRARGQELLFGRRGLGKDELLTNPEEDREVGCTWGSIDIQVEAVLVAKTRVESINSRSSKSTCLRAQRRLIDCLGDFAAVPVHNRRFRSLPSQVANWRLRIADAVKRRGSVSMRVCGDEFDVSKMEPTVLHCKSSLQTYCTSLSLPLPDVQRIGVVVIALIFCITKVDDRASRRTRRD